MRRGEEALLARNARFPPPFYSTLAGFVEVGETLEETVDREIREEAGITVGNLRYFGSQPWPFPHSLMIAFVADYVSGELAADPADGAAEDVDRAGDDRRLGRGGGRLDVAARRVEVPVRGELRLL